MIRPDECLGAAVAFAGGVWVPVAEFTRWRIIFRYGMALGSVAAATALGFLADRCNLHESIFTIYLLAVAITSWYEGAWPAVIAFAVGEFAFDYFFTPPLYSLSVTREDIAYFPVFTLFSGLLIW